MNRKRGKKPANKIQNGQKVAITKLVKSVINKRVESKQFTLGGVNAGYYDGSAGAAWTHLTSMVQSTTDTGRIGDEIYLKAINIIFNAYNGVAATANAYTTHRLCVIQVKEALAAGVNPDISKVFLATAANDGTTYGSFSARNQDYLNDYVILYDRVFNTMGSNAIAPTADSLVTNQMHLMRFSVPLKYAHKKVQFAAATTGAVNGVWLLVTTDRATVLSNPTYKVDVAVRYSDS